MLLTGAAGVQRDHIVAQLALQSSSAARLQRQTHVNTINMSSLEEDSAQHTQLPLSQLAFKVSCQTSSRQVVKHKQVQQQVQPWNIWVACAGL